MGLIDFEIDAWVVICILFCVISAIELHNAHDDYGYLRRVNINGHRRAIAGVHVRAATKHVGMALSFLTIGVLAWITNHVGSQVLKDISAIFFTVALFVNLTWSVIVTAIELRVRSRMIRSFYEDHE